MTCDVPMAMMMTMLATVMDHLATGKDLYNNKYIDGTLESTIAR
jgi:hypothetical protein